jgi:hypothetical protein
MTRPGSHRIPTAHGTTPGMWLARGGSCSATTGTEVAGFSALGDDGYIDMMFVAPKFGRRGAAGALLSHLHRIAAGASASELYTDVSITAQKCLHERFNNDPFCGLQETTSENAKCHFQESAPVHAARRPGAQNY